MKLHIQYYQTGSFDCIVEPIERRDFSLVSIPPHAYGFTFYRTTVLSSGPLFCMKTSPDFYYGGRILALKEIRAELETGSALEMNPMRTLLHNMTEGGYRLGIQNRCGNLEPFPKRSVFIPEGLLQHR